MEFDIKTGLVLELEKSIRGSRFASSDPKTPSGIANLLGISFQAARKKIKNNYFTVDEALKIQEKLFPNFTIEYLFREQAL